VLKVDIGEVEVYSLHQHVRRDEYLAVRIVEDGTVVAYTIQGRCILWLDVFCQSVDEAELS
jgi:hypothetical protein